MFWFGNQNFTASITLHRSQKELHHDIHNRSHLQGSFKKQKIGISMNWSKLLFSSLLFLIKMTFYCRTLSFFENKLNLNCAFQILFANQGVQYETDRLIKHRSLGNCFDNWFISDISHLKVIPQCCMISARALKNGGFSFAAGPRHRGKSSFSRKRVWRPIIFFLLFWVE